MSNKTKIVIGIVVIALLLLGWLLLKPANLGGSTHNSVENFIAGLIIGSPGNKAACIKVQDTDEGGWSYITS